MFLVILIGAIGTTEVIPFAVNFSRNPSHRTKFFLGFLVVGVSFVKFDAFFVAAIIALANDFAFTVNHTPVGVLTHISSQSEHIALVDTDHL